MGADPDRDPPFFFMKPADAIVENGATIPYPPQTENLHHEIELVAAIGTGGADILQMRLIMYGDTALASTLPAGTSRTSKGNGASLGYGEGLDQSAPCTALHPVSEVGHPDTEDARSIWIKVNGKIRQESTLDSISGARRKPLVIYRDWLRCRPGT